MQTALQPLENLRGCLSHLRTEKGRRREPPKADDPDGDIIDVSSPFIKDEAKILNSKSYRLLCGKTQVFTKSPNALTRTRGSHTGEVVSHSVRLCDILGLNVELARAGALAHDVGHVPFGHQGEKFLGEAMGRKDFCHEVFGCVVLQKVERKGRGANVTHEVLNCVESHSGARAKYAKTQEAKSISITDKVAYIFSDWNDVVIRTPSFPVSTELRSLMDEFGQDQRERTIKTIAGIVRESAEMGCVSFEHSELAKKFKHLRTLMYDVYTRITEQNPERYMEPVLNFFAKLNIGNPYLMVALMTDEDMIKLSQMSMISMQNIEGMAISEILQHLDAMRGIDMCDTGLDW